MAGTVGLMMLPIINTKNNKARKHAVDLGIAMQLTNIARDVFEDAKLNKWVFLYCNLILNLSKILPQKVHMSIYFF